MGKQRIRERVWDELEESGDARFPFPPHGRIPNFAGAEEAAKRLADHPVFERADALKANPDAPQLPVRRRALRAGATVYMAVPRLRDADPFLELDPAAISESDRDAAATLSHVKEYADQVGPEALPEIDLVVCGSVAVTETGDRIGKGEGFSDLEWAVLRELGRVDGETPVATTVHERQVVDADVSTAPHDVPLDLIATPERIIETETGAEKPAGVGWEALSEQRIAEVPLLERFRGD